ncbi:hypothetical protein L6164_033790 [Bauhinia variegata]|uniref:Uncharacterized protein n=1 Tax=Bauhinia variegata TaxID=167791 RepID=A0ACB9KT05_BAUVA|nr:hypothetical protein L6164_033790 [Bauhinia variegata]
MGGERVNGSWFSALWPVSRKTVSDDKAGIGILATEVSSLMMKVVHLWHCLSDREVTNLREEIVKSVGVTKLVSANDDFLLELALNEILDNFEYLARSVARLGKRCVDPVYHRYEKFVDNPAQNYLHWVGWEYRWKKMERKAKKMERFVAAMTQLSQELEVLAEVEQTFRRMQANPELHQGKLLEYQKKIMWQRQQVKNLRDMSPWNRNYDYIVRLLVRSSFTILERIILVSGSNHLPVEQQQNDFQQMNSKDLPRSHSFSVPLNSIFHLSQYDIPGFSSGPIGRRQVSNAGSVVDRAKRKNRRRRDFHSPALFGKYLHSESKQFGHVGPFKGCMSVGNDSPVIQSCMPATGGSMRLNDCHKNVDKMKSAEKLALSCRIRIYSKLSAKGRLSKAPRFTLGDAALALHYANVIILIERMVSTPDMIDLESRSDLYNMLPSAIRTTLRAKLKLFSKANDSSLYDANLSAGWNMALEQILEWLAPLAHNTIRWHSERNFEKEHATSKASVLLVHTLYFANQSKTEAAMIDLLLGLNYLYRIDREVGTKKLPQFPSTRSSNGVYLRKNVVANDSL